MNSTIPTDELFMQRCIELAKNGMFYAMPNPMVGSVLVHKGKIIGEGYHRKYGGPHAEVNAINAVSDKEKLKDSTLYVSLEPCAHHGKTPPCADLIVKNNIPRVVIGSIDPHSQVAGKGIEKLKAAGCEVKVGLMEQECMALNKAFFTFHNKKRPYIILKWAESADGFIDKIREETDPIGPNWITNEKSRQLVHKWRAECQSIVVGANTIIKDNPGLNVRSWPGNSPIRVVIDRNLAIPEWSKVYDGTSPSLVFTYKSTVPHENVEFIHIDPKRDLIDAVMDELHQRNIISLFVEGGAKLLQQMIDRNYWDEARVFRGNTRFNKGIDAPFPPHAFRQCENVFDTQLIRMYPKSIN